MNSDSRVILFTCLASFSDESDVWTSLETYEQALNLLKTCTDSERQSDLLRALLEERIKPLFVRSKSPAITQEGRKAIDSLPLNDSLHSDLDIKVKPWKYRTVYIITVIQWILTQLDEKLLEINWPLLVPPLLALIDDSSTQYKAKGCDFLRIFLKKCPPPLLGRTGLGEVFDNALMPCLIYFPSLTEETEALQVLAAAYPVVIDLALVRFPDAKQQGARITTLDKILRNGILKGYAHAGEHVKVAEVLVNHMITLIREMGTASVPRLKV
ncbi:hypothetical protein ACLMJK_003340 [Lecanora helva]